MGQRSGKHKARAPVSAGGRRGRGARAGAGHPEAESQGAAGRGRPGAEPEGGCGRGPGRASTLRGGVRRGGDALGGGGEGGGTAVAGASLVSAPAFHSLSTFDRPELRRSTACRYSEPPCCRCLLPPFAVGPSVSALCAPPCGPWMGKCSAATGLRLPASSRLSVGRVGAGSRVRRRRPEERPGPSRTAGLPGASSGSPESRRGGPPQPLLPPRGAPVMSASSHPRPRKRRKARCSPRVPRSVLCPRVRGARPGLQTLPLRKWCAALGEAEAALGAGVLPLGELLFTGEVGRALELPLAGRRVAAEWRTARARAGTRLDGDPVPEPGSHAVSGLVLGALLTITVHRASGLGDQGRVPLPNPRPPRNL